ncbi:MAG: fluoride efflux transporter CrcB [Ferruginibacter sp.]
MYSILLIGFGGFLGTVMRYMTSSWFNKHFPHALLPYGTLLVNILGSFIIGLVFGLSEKYQLIGTSWRLFWIVGFCGGFTTFSSFAYENVAMLQQSNYMGFALYTAASVLCCLLAVFSGLWLCK